MNIADDLQKAGRRSSTLDVGSHPQGIPMIDEEEEDMLSRSRASDELGDSGKNLL